jgi:hypothetical protein
VSGLVGHGCAVAVQVMRRGQHLTRLKQHFAQVNVSVLTRTDDGHFVKKEDVHSVIPLLRY